METDNPGQTIWMNGKETKFKTPHTFKNIIPDKEYLFATTINGLYSKNYHIIISTNEKTTLKIIKFYETIENMVFVRGGTFQMGSNNSNYNEIPIHTVTISKTII